MKKLIHSNQTALGNLSTLFAVLLLSSLICLPVSGQTTPPSAGQQSSVTVPLNLDADAVVKEINKDPQPVDPKAGTISTTHDVFAQSISDSENRKKISGFVEGGAAVGSFPVQRGQKTENFSCEDTAVGVSDQVNRNTQVNVYAQVDSCRPR
jgi:hypothetical protein